MNAPMISGFGQKKAQSTRGFLPVLACAQRLGTVAASLVSPCAQPRAFAGDLSFAGRRRTSPTRGPSGVLFPCEANGLQGSQGCCAVVPLWTAPRAAACQRSETSSCASPLFHSGFLPVRPSRPAKAVIWNAASSGLVPALRRRSPRAATPLRVQPSAARPGFCVTISHRGCAKTTNPMTVRGLPRLTAFHAVRRGNPRAAFFVL